MAGIASKNMPNKEVETGVAPGNPANPNETAPLLNDEINGNNYLGTLTGEHQYEEGTVSPLLHQRASTRSPSTTSVTSHRQDTEATPALPWWNKVLNVTRRVLAPAEEKRDVIDPIPPPEIPNAPMEECDCDLDHANLDVPPTAVSIVNNYFSSTSSEEDNHMTDEKSNPKVSFHQPIEVAGARRPSMTEPAFDLCTRAKESFEQGKYAEAEKLYDQAMAAWKTSVGSSNPIVADIMNSQAVVLTKQGKLKEAEELCLRVLESTRKDFGVKHANYAAALNSQAGVLRAKGKYSKAETKIRSALKIWENSLGREHHYVAVACNNLAELLRIKEKYKEADQNYLQAIKIDEKIFGPDHPQVATDLNNRAELLRAQGKYTEAKPLYERVLGIWKRHYGQEHPDVATALNNQAELLADQGKYAEAEHLNAQALEIDEKCFGPNHPEVATDLNNRAWLLECRGKHAEAESLFARSKEIRERAFGDDHPAVVESLNNRTFLLAEQGKSKEASPLYSRAIGRNYQSNSESKPKTLSAQRSIRRRLSRSEKRFSRSDTDMSEHSFGGEGSHSFTDDV